jgi:hypothetical protein
MEVFSIIVINDFLFIFFDQYKFIDNFYNFYINLYWIYKFIKHFTIILYFHIFRLYLIFINNSMLLNNSGILFINFYKFKKWWNNNFKYFNKRILKLNRKYKNYYKFYPLGSLKIFFFFLIFYLIYLMFINKSTYYKHSFITFPIIFYLIVIHLCFILVPLFYNQFLGIIFVIIFSFIICYLRILN